MQDVAIYLFVGLTQWLKPNQYHKFIALNSK